MARYPHRPRVVAQTDIADLLHEQLDHLIAVKGDRYQRVYLALMELFVTKLFPQAANRAADASEQSTRTSIHPE